MEIENLFGLPAHPLIVHLPVVLIPLAAILAVVVALRPAWLDRFGWLLVGLSGVGALGAIFAAGSGEALEELVDETEQLERHAELGETARNVAILFFVVVLAVVLFRRWSAKKAAGGGSDVARVGAAAVVSTLLLIGAAGVAGVSIVQAGHAGAETTWSGEGEEGEEEGDAPSQGEEHEDEDEDDD